MVLSKEKLTNTFALKGWNINFKNTTKGDAYKLRPAEADEVNLLRKVAMWILRLPNGLSFSLMPVLFLPHDHVTN